MLLYGDPKVGKSYAALQLAACMTSGAEWLGFPIPQAVPVVYVQLDTPRSLWAVRVQDLVTAGHPVDSVHMADRETLNTHPFDIKKPEHFMLLQTALAPLGAGAVIIDTLRESHSGDENDSTDMQRVIAHLEAAVKPAALILISHAKKPSQDQSYSLMNDNRGSSYIVGRMDSIVRFSHTSMRCTSRTIEEHSTALIRAEDGTWDLVHDGFEENAQMLLMSHPEMPLRELARLLHERTSKSAAACRSWLQRHGKKSIDTTG